VEELDKTISFDPPRYLDMCSGKTDINTIFFRGLFDDTIPCGSPGINKPIQGIRYQKRPQFMYNHRDELGRYKGKK